ncbi:MAG: rod shape-determining protein RodA [Candidatus Dependentiae bacterium]
MLIDKRYLRYFDWVSFFLIFILSAIGLLFVFSATYKPDLPFSLFFKKQLFGVLSGFLIYFIFCLIDFRTIMRWGYFLYFAVIGLLLFTIIKGSIGMGAQRWINLGIVKVQPSELAKLFFPTYAAYYFYTEKETLQFQFKEFIPILIMLLFSCLLIRKQPDLGTAILLGISGLLVIWFAGMNKKFFLISFLVLAISTPVTWHFLKPYQKKRVLVFLGHGESKKERYQIEQSEIAIGAGGLTGSGILKGTQNKLQFLPESRTDFIFSVIAEETGFIGVLTLLCLFGFLFFRFLVVIQSVKSPFFQLLALGVVSHVIFAALINICMVTGLLPVVGIPLPFISYGLSNLWVTFASLGLFNGIAIRRFYFGE